ncbi:MAG: phenylalanine--tRNA ligase subunit beta [Christensenellaceae bacterium]|nr:phenylalanine--tRNA ligase subunit beta [Christensenellaceae bacterium]
MLASYTWLKDYVDIKETPEELAEKMIMTGNGVEGIREIGADITNVVVGRIDRLEKHPDADRLQICTIDIGKDEPVQIVTGATNVFEGAKVPAALVGANLPCGMTIKKGKLRGVESYGMLCSGEELCLDAEEYPGSDVNGIYILDENAPAGQDIREYLGIGGSVIEFEIGANRPDCLSMIGIAKEAAAATGSAFKEPDTSFAANSEDVSDYISVEVRNTESCPRYMAAAVKDIRIAESPEWMKKRLREAGIRAINNIVDITNFVMIETGQPMHAFDASDIGGSKIIVRNAEEGEKITTLDDKERELNTSMLMICDGMKPIGIAGVMGGQNSEIKDDTKTIIFESANFNYGNIRQTSRALGLSTESSMRFSKGVAPATAEFALKRALHLVCELGCGEVVGGMVDINNADTEKTVVKADSDYINGLLGTDIPKEDMIKYLNMVGIATEAEGTLLICEVPQERTDLTIPADIAEEVARMYGYDNIPSTELRSGNRNSTLMSRLEVAKDALRGYLSATGFCECVTYSFAGEQDSTKLGLEMPESIKIRNPLGDDTAYMRTNLVSDMLKVVSLNMARKNNDLRLYELGKTYFPNDDASVNAPVIEKPAVILACAGKDEDFYTLKGVLENAVSLFSGKSLKCTRCSVPYLHPGRSAAMFVGKFEIGRIGQVAEEVLERYDIPHPVYIAYLYLANVEKLDDRESMRFAELPKFPASERDIAVIVDDDTGAGDVLATIKASGGKKLESAELFDVYRSDQLGEGKKSLAYRMVFRADDRTLTDEETDAAFSKILRTLEREYGAKLR